MREIARPRLEEIVGERDRRLELQAARFIARTPCERPGGDGGSGGSLENGATIDPIDMTFPFPALISARSPPSRSIARRADPITPGRK